MRILYIDIDSLRPDHLGCYGYHRATSPNIDRLSAEGIRFDNCYVSDAPCLPSRTALISGRFGIHTGLGGAAGTAGQPFVEGQRRGFHDLLATTSWMAALRAAGHRTASVSSFGQRHGAWHWYAGFDECYNPGKRGWEHADDVTPLAESWLDRNGRDENWVLHVNYWDPHTPYRTPEWFGTPFADSPPPDWLTEEIRRRDWEHGGGPVSARERDGLDGGDAYSRPYPRQPGPMVSMREVRRMFDEYDTGVLFADRAVGQLIGKLDALGVLGETAVVVSADHGEALGEMNIYGCHQLADNVTCHVPMIVRWPGLPGGARRSLCYQFDVAAAVIELAGGKTPPNWDGRSVASSLREGSDQGRPFLVCSQGAASCARGVRFGDFMCTRNYHDGLHGLPDTMLYDVRDIHQRNDLAAQRPDLVGQAMTMLEHWHTEMMRTATHPQDPMWTILLEGGPGHSRGHLESYVRRLRQTGRDAFAELLESRHSSGGRSAAKH
jgi:arylsulfatase A-like enzyme